MGPMNASPACSTAAANSGVLGEKSVTGMHGVGARLLAGAEDALDRQVAVGGRRRTDFDPVRRQAHVHRVALGLGVHRNRLEPHAIERADDAAGDLAPVRDQDPAHVSGRRRRERESG